MTHTFSSLQKSVSPKRTFAQSISLRIVDISTISDIEQIIEMFIWLTLFLSSGKV